MCRRLGLTCCQTNTAYRKLLSLFQYRKLLVFQCLLFFVIVRASAFVNFFPASTHNRLATCHKTLSRCLPFHGSLFIFKWRIKNTQKSPHNHIIDFALFICHMIQLYKLLCRNDCMMVTDLFIIHETSVCMDWFSKQRTGKFSIWAGSTGFQSLFDRRDNILADITGIRSRIRKYLMILI